MNLLETDIKGGLESFFKEQMNSDDKIEISDIRYINIGNENDIYSFVACMHQHEVILNQDYIVRIYAGVYTAERANAEYNNLQKLRKAGYPVPEVIGIDLSGKYLGRPFFIMERIIGKNLHEVLINAEEEAYDRLTDNWIKQFVDLHQLDYSEFINEDSFLKSLFPYSTLFDQAYEYTCIDNYIYGLRFLLAMSHSSDDFCHSLKWLEDNKTKASCCKPSVTHQDFNDNNILVDNKGKLFVIDWSGMDVSDYRIDLASALQVWTKYSDMLQRNKILHTYEKLAEVKVENIEYFEAAVCLKKLILVYISIENNINKHGIRTATDVELELLNYLSTYHYWLQITGIKIPFMENVH